MTHLLYLEMCSTTAPSSTTLTLQRGVRHEYRVIRFELINWGGVLRSGRLLPVGGGCRRGGDRRGVGGRPKNSAGDGCGRMSLAGLTPATVEEGAAAEEEDADRGRARTKGVVGLSPAGLAPATKEEGVTTARVVATTDEEVATAHEEGAVVVREVATVDEGVATADEVGAAAGEEAMAAMAATCEAGGGGEAGRG